jgi:hypothetical protein
MVRAVEKVRERLLRATRALEAAEARYAVIGGNAVAAWVATVEEAAVRNTQDVDILVDPGDFALARRALEEAGFIYRRSAGVHLFLNGPGAKARDAVHVVLAGDTVRPGSDLKIQNSFLFCILRSDPIAASSATEAVCLAGGMRVLALDALVRMKLTSFRRKDQVHLLDLIGVGLLGEADLAKLPATLATRLRELLENPEG